jgi:hypothetical protein
LLVHAKHQGFWSMLGEQFEEDMQSLWSSLAPSKSWSRMFSKSRYASRRNREFSFRRRRKYRPDHPEGSCMKCSRCSKSIALK